MPSTKEIFKSISCAFDHLLPPALSATVSATVATALPSSATNIVVACHGLKTWGETLVDIVTNGSLRQLNTNQMLNLGLCTAIYLAGTGYGLSQFGIEGSIAEAGLAITLADLATSAAKVGQCLFKEARTLDADLNDPPYMHYPPIFIP